MDGFVKNFLFPAQPAYFRPKAGNQFPGAFFIFSGNTRRLRKFQPLDENMQKMGQKFNPWMKTALEWVKNSTPGCKLS